jgi:hypothetical protein
MHFKRPESLYGSRRFVIKYPPMTAGERDKRMDEIATAAATAFCRKWEAATKEQIERSQYPEKYLELSLPYLTIRTLHRVEKALKSMEKDSRWIKFLTVVLVALTIVLAIYAWRLDETMKSLQKIRPAATSSPAASPVTH